LSGGLSDLFQLERSSQPLRYDTVLSQIPSFIGGQIVSIVYIEYSVAGVQLDELLGGLNTSIIEWGVGSDLGVLPVDNILEPPPTVFVYISAYDFDKSISDFEIFPFTVE
jgi:hypothetical protein